jgi:hypothetical protein
MLLFASGPETSACIVTQNVLPKFLGTVGDSWNCRTKYRNREDFKNGWSLNTSIVNNHSGTLNFQMGWRLWKEADADIPIFITAQAEYAKLK